MLIAGGQSSPPNVGGLLLASAEVYDPALGTFRRAGDLLIAHTATLLPHGKVLIARGIDAKSGPGADSSADAELFRFW